MNGRTFLACTLAGTVALFVWQAVSNAALPWHMAAMHPFADTSAASVKGFRAQAPTNGVYWNPHGIIAIVNATPDYVDQTTLIGGMLGKQVVIDIVVVAMLCVFTGRLRDGRPTAVASSAALAGLVVSAAAELANWNWYGYAAGLTVVNIVDATIGFFVTGLAIGWLARRMSRSEAAGVVVPAGAGYSGAKSPTGVR